MIAEWANREMKSPGGGKALLFEQPLIDGKPSKFPVAINTMGSRAPDGAGVAGRQHRRISRRRFSSSSRRNRRPICAKAGACSSRAFICCMRDRSMSKEGACQEVVHRFAERPTSNDQTITFIDYARSAHSEMLAEGWRAFHHAAECPHPRSGHRARAMSGCIACRFTTTARPAMHWQVHKVGARHGKRYYERNERMPVAVTLGGDPAYTFAATAPLPDGLDEILFAGFMRKKSVELVPCKTIDLEVPADVDFVLEGYVQPGETRPEGPFGDHTGYLHRGRGLSRSSISPRSRIGATRSIRPRSSAFRRWRISTSATPASGFSCRSSK